MTKLLIFGALAMVAITVGVIAVIPQSQGKKTEASKVETFGLPKHQLEVVGPKDPTFNKLIERETTNVGKSKAQPFSVFVVNNSDQAIASCTLKYEIIMRDGQTATHFTTRTGLLEPVSDSRTAQLPEGIAAKGNLLVSLTDSVSPNNQHMNFRTSGGGSSITEQLSNSVEVKVSIDGVLFVDGTYVGPDTNNYFELFRGKIAANRELDTEIAQLINDGANSKAIMNHLEKVANIKSSEAQILPGEDSQYAFGKWVQKNSYARLLSLMGKKKGDQAVLDRIRTGLSEPEIKLRKLKEN
jgi:hypothetical protein